MLQRSPGFINLQVYREISEDSVNITYMQIENWEDEESLENDLSSPHVKNFENQTGHMYDMELKKYSNEHFFIWIVDVRFHESSVKNNKSIIHIYLQMLS